MSFFDSLEKFVSDIQKKLNPEQVTRLKSCKNCPYYRKGYCTQTPTPTKILSEYWAQGCIYYGAEQPITGLMTETERETYKSLLDRIKKIDLVDLITEITTIKTLQTLDLIKSISSVTDIVNIQNLQSVDLIDAISNIVNIQSVDLIDAITTISNIRNIQSVDLVDEITTIGTIEQIDKVRGLHWYDRNPLPVFKHFSALNVAPHSDVERWTYTVPANRKAFAELAFSRVTRATVASTLNVVTIKFYLKPNGQSEHALLYQFFLGNNVSDTDTLYLGHDVLMNAGDRIRLFTADSCVGGSNHYCCILKLTEFDA